MVAKTIVSLMREKQQLHLLDWTTASFFFFNKQLPHCSPAKMEGTAQTNLHVLHSGLAAKKEAATKISCRNKSL